MRWWIYFTIICNLFLTSLAFANLGSTESASTTQYNRYRVHESSKNWVKVHEFSGSDGKVFALAWSGKKHPDLQTLLGAHLVDLLAGEEVLPRNKVPVVARRQIPPAQTPLARLRFLPRALLTFLFMSAIRARPVNGPIKMNRSFR
jgi:hypothetical protein